jgi:hypothetical protein
VQKCKASIRVFEIDDGRRCIVQWASTFYSAARIFQLDPVRVYYVHNIDGKWLFWGRVFIQTLKIEKKLQPDRSWKEGDWITSGTYKIVDIYDPVYQETVTRHEAQPDRNYFVTG